ncbi:MAG: prolyl oligopeptidase family serine peptidase [Oscillospiraceae bacterium]|nr:prolyl oligopeptidase family serine peptidase [Oscillospiraceae bacterium]
MKEFKRGEIYYINFPYTFDVNYPKGKNKFVVILQEGAIFKEYDAVTVLLITSDEESKDFETNVTIEAGLTKLNKESYIICAQPYTILKSLFDQSGVWCAGILPNYKLDEVDECLYIGLCMGIQNEVEDEGEASNMTDIKLWETATPYYNAEYSQPEPTLTPYLLPKPIPHGCVIVCPGGGYAGRAPHEGEPIAKMLNAGGFSAFVLNYRFAPYKDPVMLTDVKRAVKLVRYNAAKWNIDPEKIGVLGFSAGGHLAMTAIEHFDYGCENGDENAEKVGDEIDKVSSRPNAGILCYAVISFIDPTTHQGTLHNLLGENPAEDMKIKYSGELNVREDSPPVFLWHTAEDGPVPVANSLNMALALQRENIPFELHIFPYGVHGLGLSPNDAHVAQWAPLLVNWLKLNGF